MSWPGLTRPWILSTEKRIIRLEAFVAGGTSIRERVRDELLKRAKAHPVELVTYGSLAKCLGVHVMAVSNKKMLADSSSGANTPGLTG